MPSLGLLKALSRAQVQLAHRRPIEQVLAGLLAAILDATSWPNGFLASVVPDEDAEPCLALLAHTDPQWAYESHLPMKSGLLRRAAFGTNVTATNTTLPTLPAAEHVLVLPIWYEQEPIGLLALSGDAELSDATVARLEDTLAAVAVFLEDDRAAVLERRALRRLQQAETRHRSVVQGALDAVLVFDTDGCVVDANQAARSMFCSGDEGLLGRQVHMLLEPAATPGRHSCVGHTPNGPVHVSVTTHLAQEGDQKLMVCFVRDCSETNRAELELQTTNATLQARVHELAQLNRENEVLGKFGGFLQACDSIKDVYRVLERFLPELFEGSRGTYNVLNGTLLEQEIHWGGASGATVFSRQDCWAFRRGDTHHSGPEVCCGHLQPGSANACCVPVMTGDGALGLLHIEISEGSANNAGRRLSAVADRLGAALTNLMLRDRLRQESIRDPLTRLFNRRYMMETLERELARARRAKQEVAVIMLDVDHFKRLNDEYGHDVGDEVLQAVSAEMSGSLRAEDVVCRYGGEEFVAILPGASLELARARADELRHRLAVLSVHGRQGILPTVTVSAGVAVARAVGTPESVLRAADRALLQAKQNGRDQVCMTVDGVVLNAA